MLEAAAPPSAPAPPAPAPATLLKKEEEVWDWLGLVSWAALALAVLEVVKGYSELEPEIEQFKTFSNCHKNIRPISCGSCHTFVPCVT